MNMTETTEETGIPQVKKVLYTASMHTTGGREGGSSKSSDGRLDVKTSIPGAPGNGTNPEQLFAAGWSTCFTSAMKAVAGKMKVKFPPDHATDAEVDLCLDRRTLISFERASMSACRAWTMKPLNLSWMQHIKCVRIRKPREGILMYK